MKNQNLFALMIATLFTITSCSIYTPNALNTPLLKEKGDFEIAAHAGNGSNLQAAYGITNNVGIIANYNTLNSTVTINDDERKRTGSSYEVGVGYFNKKPDSKAVFEIYSGVGRGNVKIDRTIGSSSDISNFKVNTTKIFVQPAIGSVSKNFEFSFATRVSCIQFRNITTNFTAADLLDDKLDNLEKPLWLFAEPTLTMRMGFENVKFQIQIGRSFKLNKEDLKFQATIFNLGLIGRI